jgi:protein SCO1/2
VKHLTTLRHLAIAAALLASAVPARAERPLLADQLPPELEGVGIVEHLDERIPLDLEFVDDTGQAVRLERYFRGERPVLLTLNFYRCEMLCTLTLNGVVDALNDLKWSAGEEFDIVTVSIAHEEGPDLANVKKRAYLTQYRRESAADGWHFLTGTKENIEALAMAVGFGFRKVKTEKDYEYAHTSSIMFLTPDGRISRYMNDVVFESKDVRLALVEASNGAIGSPMDKFLVFMCYHYDPDKGNYGPSAMKLMRLGAAVTLCAVVCGLVVLGLRGSRTQRPQDPIHFGGLQS